MNAKRFSPHAVVRSGEKEENGYIGACAIHVFCLTFRQSRLCAKCTDSAAYSRRILKYEFHICHYTYFFSAFYFYPCKRGLTINLKRCTFNKKNIRDTLIKTSVPFSMHNRRDSREPIVFFAAIADADRAIAFILRRK